MLFSYMLAGLGFVIIAMIVSFDVAGLTLSKSSYYAKRPEKLRSWAVLNGFWHAALLAVYGAVISGLFSFFDLNLDWFLRLLDWISLPLFPHAADIAAFLEEHLPIITGMIAIVVIWVTYRAKVADIPSEADREALGGLAKYFFDILEIVVRVGSGRSVTQQKLRQFLRENVEAALVAVDMLALALLANRLGMMDSFESIAAFSLIVFLVVMTICFCVGLWSKKYFEGDEVRFRLTKEEQEHCRRFDRIIVDPRQIQKQWWLVTLRLLEPWLIFYFALELLSVLLFGKQTHSPGYIAGTSLMLLAIIKSQGLGNIIDATLKTNSVYETESKITTYELRPIVDICTGLVWFTVKFVGLFALGLICIFTVLSGVWELYVWSFNEADPAFDAITSFALLVMAVLASIFQFVSDGLKARIANVFDWLDENKYAFFFSISALLIAVAVPIVHELTEEVIRDNSLRFGDPAALAIIIQPSHVHALQVLFSLFWLFLMSLSITWLKPDQLGGVNDGVPAEFTWREIVMVHDKGGKLLLPLAATIFFMAIMIKVNQFVYDWYLALEIR